MAELGDLFADLLSGDERRAERAAEQLPSFHEQALKQINQLLVGADPDARWWAVRVLAGFPTQEAGRLLAGALKDKDDAVRYCAALALARQPYDGAIQPLARLLRSSDRLLARLAGDALIAVGAPAVPVLLEALEKSKVGAQTEAARALAKIGDTRPSPVLFTLLDSDSAIMEHWATEGLDKMGLGMTFFKP